MQLSAHTEPRVNLNIGIDNDAQDFAESGGELPCRGLLVDSGERGKQLVGDLSTDVALADG